MKKIYHIALIALVAMIAAQEAKAQKVDMETGLVVWEGSTVADALRITSEGGFFYLVEFKETLDVDDKELYVAARGAYGVQAVMSSVGMRMQMESSTREVNLTGGQPTTCYQFISRIENADTQSDYLGDRMGIDSENNGANVFLDRSSRRAYWEGNTNNCVNFPNWALNASTQTKRNVRYKGEAAPHTVSVTTYTIQNVETQGRRGNGSYNGTYQPTYIRINNEGKLVSTTNANQATKFVIVSEDDFNDAMQQVTWGEVDLGVFVQDATFGRDNKDGIYWVWENADVDANGKTLDEISLNTNPRHWHQRNQDVMCNGVMLQNGISRAMIGQNVAGTGGTVDHDGFRNSYGQYYAAEIYNEVNSLTQTLHGGKIPNLVDGLYKLTAQALYYDDVNGTTNDGVAYFVVKRDVLGDDGVTVVESTTEYMPIKPMNNESGNNITPHSGVSAGYVFNNNENAYLLTTFVEISGKVNLTIGIQQRQAKGWTVIGNVHLFAHGKQAMYVDEDWSNSETLTYIEGDVEKTTTGNPYDLARWHDNYDYPSTVYYQRTFTVGKWNPICMPLNLTGRQVRQAFGADAKVCAFQGQHDSQKSLLYFTRALDLDKDENMDKVVIEAGTPYIIYVSNNPQYPNGITAEVGNGAFNHTITIEGATYAIPGVIKEQLTAYQDETSTGVYQLRDPIEVAGKGGFKMVGSFYRTKINKNDVRYDFGGSTSGNTSGNNYWVITKGDMYHLAGTRDWNIWATYAYIYLPTSASGNAKEFSFAIDDGTGIDEVTTIEGIEIVKGDKLEDNDVYTLSGQKVGKGSLEGLPKGIYMMNGRKFVKN